MSTLSLIVASEFENLNLSHSATLSLTGTKYVHLRQTIGSGAEEQLGKGDLTGGMICVIKNLDSTNLVTVGGATGVRPLVLNPGEIGVYRFNSNVFFIQAAVADVNVEFVMFEDDPV